MWVSFNFGDGWFQRFRGRWCRLGFGDCIGFESVVEAWVSLVMLEREMDIEGEKFVLFYVIFY